MPEDLEESRSPPRDVSLCGHVVANDDMLVVRDLARDPRFANNPFVKERGFASTPVFLCTAPTVSPSEAFASSTRNRANSPRKSRNCSKRLRRMPWKTLNGDAYSTTAHLAQWRKASVAALARSSVRDLQVFGNRLRSDVNFPRLSMSAFSRFCRESYSSLHC